MKTNFKVLLLLAMVLLAACKDDNNGGPSQQEIKKTAEDFVTIGADFFAYDANDLLQVNSGYAVADFSSGDDLSAVVNNAKESGNIVCGERDWEGNYVYHSMKHFGNVDEAKEYATANGAEACLNLDAKTWWPFYYDEKFKDNQTVTDGGVTIKCMPEKYYFVTLDFRGKTNKEIGLSYGKCISKLPVYYTTRVALYVNFGADQLDIDDIAERAATVSKALDQEDRDLMDGIAEGLKASWLTYSLRRELMYCANLVPDVLRPTACSAFGVMPEMSATGKTMVYRTLDWPDGIDEYNLFPDGRKGIVSPLQSITKMIFSDRTIYSFGMLGIVCAVTSIDATNGNMVAILDSDSGEPYTCQGKRSYVFDLSHALEVCTTIDDISEYMGSSDHNYTYNHLLLMADSEEVGIFENNVSGKGEYPQRAMRNWNSPLGDQFEGWDWGYDYIIGAVNCFMLNGQQDNFRRDAAACNPARLLQMQSKTAGILDAKPEGSRKLTSDDLLAIQKTHNATLNPKLFDNLYNYNTLQMIQYIPEDNVVRVHLKSFNGTPVADPAFFSLTLTED